MIGRLIGRRRFMREHAWTHSHLSEYVDRDLAETDTRRVDSHVEVCPQCRRVLATLRRTIAGLRELAAPGAGGLADGVIERLHEED